MCTAFNTHFSRAYQRATHADKAIVSQPGVNFSGFSLFEAGKDIFHVAERWIEALLLGCLSCAEQHFAPNPFGGDHTCTAVSRAAQTGSNLSPVTLVSNSQRALNPPVRNFSTHCSSFKMQLE